MDHVIHANYPTIMAPRFSVLEPMRNTGERYVVTSRRLMFEVSRPWLHAIKAISEDFMKSTPYGENLPESITLRCGAVPSELLGRFIEQARAAAPIETAAWIVWNQETKVFAYLPLAIKSATPAHVHFERPALPLGTHLVMDIHSHGHANAFFSKVDDADDADQLCMSVVVGRVNQPQPEMVARLSMLGVYKPVEL